MRRVLWVVLLATILLMVPALKLRIDNEQRNHSVILAGEYDELNTSPEKLRKAGMTAAILGESGTPGSFDIPLMEGLRKEGMEVVLRLDSLAHSRSYYENLTRLIEKLSVKYLLVCPGQNISTPYGSRPSPEQMRYMKEIIRTHGLILFTMENREQSGYAGVPGLDTLIPGAGYPINRAFSLSRSGVFPTSPEDAALVWLRAVIDRNIRLVCIQPLRFGAEKPGSSDGSTLEAQEKLTALLHKKGFSTDRPVAPLDSSIPGLPQSLPAVVSLLLALALYLAYLAPQKRQLIPAVIIPCLIPAVLLIVFREYGAGIWAAFAASLIYPSLSGLLILKYLKTSKSNLFIRTACSLLLLFFVNGMGILTIASSMADIRYTMHLINFSMVFPAYILPLGAFALNFLACSGKRLSSIIPSKRNPAKKRRLLVNLLYGAILLLLLFIYLERSGNYNLLPASGAELEIRKFLEQVMYARPRTKEFLVGYPCLFAFIYLYGKNVSARLLALLGALSAITGVSMVNSFCHGFTPLLTSFNRTLNGFLLGLVPGAVSLMICAALLKMKAKRGKILNTMSD